MKGELHRRVQAQLQKAWKAGVFKQESLSAVMKKSQRSVSEYLRGAAQAGALDLDEAAAALHHANSSLDDFLAGLPARDLSAADAIARRLEGRDDLIGLVEVLLGVPKKRLPAVIEQIDVGVFVATGRRLLPPDEATFGTTQGARTTKGSKRRR